MIIVGGVNRSDACHRSGTLSDGSPASAIHLISNPSVLPPGTRTAAQPHAFIVKQAPDSTLHAHFHFNRQFQLVVAGSGMIGSHLLSPGVVHYAAAETAYGPIRAGADGLSYMTLRQVTELGAQYLPVKGDILRRGIRRRQLTSDIPPSRAVDGKHVALIAADETGLAAWCFDAAPGSPLLLSQVMTGGDHFVVVLSGSARCLGEYLPSLSVAWIGAQDAPPPWVAGDEGARLIAMRFPTRD